MLVPADTTESLFARPLLHSTRYHCADAPLPTATLVRSVIPRTADRATLTLVYEIVLAFGHGRACTIYRTWDDFDVLRRHLVAPSRADAPCCRTPISWTPYSWNDVSGLHEFLREALTTRRHERAVGAFLRRRVDDCDCRWNRDRARIT